MKKLKQFGLALAVILTTGTAVNAQMIKGGLHLTPSLPLGAFGTEFGGGTDLTYGAGFGIGGSLHANYFMNENFHVGVEAGFASYGLKDYEMINPLDGTTMTVEPEGSYNLIPVQLTAAYHTDAEDEMDFYFGSGVGVFILGSSEEGFESKTFIGFTPRVGMAMEISRDLWFDANISYMTTLAKNEEIEYQTMNPNDPFGPMITQTMEVKYPGIAALNINIGITYLLWD